MDENIVKVACIPDEQNDRIEVEINLDEYYLYVIEYAGCGNWHIEGWRCDDKCGNGCIELITFVNGKFSMDGMAKILACIRTRRGPEPFFKDRIKGFWNVFGIEGFYESLGELLALVKKYEQEKE